MISFSPSLSPPTAPIIPPIQSPNCTEEQLAAIHWTHQATGNLILEAVAGSGKTFTIIEMCVAIVLEAIKRNEPPRKLIALMSFNAKVRDELKHRIQLIGLSKEQKDRMAFDAKYRTEIMATHKGLLPWVEVNTVHGFAFSAFKSQHGPRKPNSYKLSDILDPILKSLRLDWKFSKPICQTVSIAKDCGMDLFFPNNGNEWKKLIDYHDITWDEDKLPMSSFINLCSDLFHRSIKDTDKIDFSDMIWMPLKQGLTFPQFDFVFIDEAQDTNATRREVARRMLKQFKPDDTFAEQDGDPPRHQREAWEPLKPLGRLIAVGDRHQAIYGFTGADNDALDILKKEFNASELPLSTCFRCSKAVIRHAQRIVPHIQPRVGAIEGAVHLSMPEYNFHNLLFQSGTEHTFQRSAILCRKNAPLISLAFQLVNKQIPCRIEGRDIGQDLIRLCKKFNPESKDHLALSLRKHLNDQALKLSPYKLDVLSDKISAITSVLSLPIVTSVPQLYQQIEQLFSDYDPTKPPKLTLSSVHKSKGLEWPIVYLLGRNAFMPSIFATQPWMEQQEQNLIYVAITRAMETLYEITVEE